MPNVKTMLKKQAYTKMCRPWSSAVNPTVKVLAVRTATSVTTANDRLDKDDGSDQRPAEANQYDK